MSVTIRKINAKAKDPVTGELKEFGLFGSDALEVIETKKQEAVAAVTEEKDDFLAAIQDKGEEYLESIEDKGETTLASIPNDYTELANEVSDLKGDLSDVNERLGIAEGKIDDIVPGLTDIAKTALINCFANVSWNNNGKVYYDALVAALYYSYPRISATYNPGVNVIYTDDTLDTLKQYITVKYYATSESEGVIIGSNSYTLSGTLAEGTNNITVTYDGLTTTVIVPDVTDFYNIWEWDSRFTGAGKLTRTPVRAGEFTYEGVSRKGILYNTTLISSNNNRGFATLRGKAPMVTEDNVTLSNYYPIPIPATATITPNTQRLSPVLFQYDPTNQTPAPYSRIGSIGWYVGTRIVTFTASENLFLAFNCSIDESFTRYTSETEPEMNVVFE